MARYDFRTPRLFVDAPLSAGGSASLNAPQAHYLRNVMRLPDGAGVLAFNGRDGEWAARLAAQGKRGAQLTLERQTRPQDTAGDLHYLFAPLKAARLDYMIQKAVELGVSRLVPVLTQHTQATRLNTERARANAIEAAEQCGVLSVPAVHEPMPLAKAIAATPENRVLIFCDENADNADPLKALAAISPGTPLAVLIGPEGGFHDSERTMLLARGNVVRLALGPRILRADTAAVAALTLVQAVAGDWR